MLFVRCVCALGCSSIRLVTCACVTATLETLLFFLNISENLKHINAILYFLRVGSDARRRKKNEVEQPTYMDGTSHEICCWREGTTKERGETQRARPSSSRDNTHNATRREMIDSYVGVELSWIPVRTHSCGESTGAHIRADH